MKSFLLQLFTWWGPQTMGTRWTTWRSGERVGADELGNTYFRTRGGVKDKALGLERRWVVYSSEADASKVPPGWYGWLHHTVDVPPSREDYKSREWQLPHKANMTGTVEAYRPPGSALHSGGHRPAVSADYEAWTPGG
jgi:NADH:ubiquinone oxidoreductase subunit